MVTEKSGKRRVAPKRELSVFDEMLEPFKAEEWAGDLTPSMREVAKSKQAEVTLAECLAVFETRDDQPLPDFLESLKANPTPGLETENERVTNREQTDNKRVTNREQTDNKRVTNEPPAKEQTGNKQRTERVTERSTNGVQTDNKRVTERVTERVTSSPVVVVSSSSPEILNYNYDDLHIPKSLLEIGLSRRHLLKSKLTPDEMQSSLEAFAFDLEAGAVKPKRTTPLGLFIGVVVNSSQPYTSTQDLEAQAKDLNEYLVLKRAAEERAAAQVDLERAIAFEKWIQTATNEEQAQLIRPTESAPAGSMIYRNALKAKFLETPSEARKSP
jgi:hypothetical protein